MRFSAKRVIKWVLPILAALLVVIYGFITFRITSGLIAYERRPQEDNPSTYGIQYEDVQFTSRSGDVTLKGWYMPGESRNLTIIFVHGIGSLRSGDNAVEIASQLVNRGFSTLLFDLRGHGESGGDKISGGYFEQDDVLGAIDFLINQGIPTESIGVIGFSMGASTAILALVEEPALQALVADSPYAKASELISHEAARKTGFPEWITPIFMPTVKIMASTLYGIDIGSLVLEEAVKQLSYPILFIHGMSDTRIPCDHCVRIHKEANAGSIIWLVPETEHVDAFITHPVEYVNKVASYFNSRLINK